VDPFGFNSSRTGRGHEANPVLYALAAKTGGFPVVNTNDLKGGMEKAAAELDESTCLGMFHPIRVTTGAITGFA